MKFLSRDRNNSANSVSMNKKPKTSRKRKLAWVAGSIVVAVLLLMYTATWFSSSMLLYPSFKGLGKNFSTCKPETEKYFGKACGNLRESKAFAFNEVKVASQNGYDMPGWLIKAADNGKPTAKGAIMLVHAGGSDRREDTQYIGMYLNQGLDVLTFDQGCAGEAPCPVSGLSYGARESSDVFSAYLYMTQRYSTVYAMGTSVGASSILIALPEMPKLAGVIAESPYANFERLVKEAPESKNIPAFATSNMLAMTKSLGEFDALRSPEHSLPLAGNTVPVFFIHSKADAVANYKQTEDLVRLYDGPTTVWYPDKGEHALTMQSQPAEYQQRISDFLASVHK
jgi:alpha-beta hydrolase superfamily lysophospholipase